MTKGDYVRTPRFLTVRIEVVFDSEEDAIAHGYKEPTHYYDNQFGIYGKTLDPCHMTFAAYRLEPLGVYPVYPGTDRPTPLEDELSYRFIDCYYKVIAIQIDSFESSIVDERNASSKREAEALADKMRKSGDNIVTTIVKVKL